MQAVAAFAGDSENVKLQIEGQDFDNLDQAAATSSILYAVEIVHNMGEEEVKGEYT